MLQCSEHRRDGGGIFNARQRLFHGVKSQQQVQLRNPGRDMIGMVAGSAHQFNGQITAMNGQALIESDRRWYQYDIAKYRITTLILCQPSPLLVRLHAYQAMLMSDDWCRVFACEIVIAPGMIPIGMAIDDQHLLPR